MTLITGPGARPDGDHVVYNYDFRASNPYQSLLYSHWPDAHVFESGPSSLALYRQENTSGRRMVFHLHWENYCYVSAENPGQAAAAVEAFMAPIRLFKQRGGILLWTVHNAEPHENRFPDLDLQMRRELATLADAVIVHSDEAARIIGETGLFDLSRIHAIPHGNFRSLFKEHEDGAAARLNFFGNLNPTLLFFGMLRQYKGLLPFLKSYSVVAESQAVNLLLAGRGTETLNKINHHVFPSGGKIRVLGEAQDSIVPMTFAAADFAVFPFQKILTSSSLILALSLARPVIVPGFPTMRELVVDGVNGFTYDPEDPDGLTRAIQRTLALTAEDRQKMSEAARDTALGLDWFAIGRTYADVLAGVGHGAPVTAEGDAARAETPV